MLQTVRIGRHKRRLAGQTGNPDVSTAIQVAPSTLGRADPGSVPGTGYEKELRPVGLKNCKKLGGILEEFLNSLRKPVLPKSEFGGILALENEPSSLTASNRIACGEDACPKGHSAAEHRLRATCAGPFKPDIQLVFQRYELGSTPRSSPDRCARVNSTYYRKQPRIGFWRSSESRRCLRAGPPLGVQGITD